MPVDLTLDEFIAGVRAAARRRRNQDTRLFGPRRQAPSLPTSDLPPDLVAELDALAHP